MTFWLLIGRGRQDLYALKEVFCSRSRAPLIMKSSIRVSSLYAYVAIKTFSSVVFSGVLQPIIREFNVNRALLVCPLCQSSRETLMCFNTRGYLKAACLEKFLLQRLLADQGYPQNRSFFLFIYFFTRNEGLKYFDPINLKG